MDLLSYIMVGAEVIGGIYFLYSAITGKGKAFELGRVKRGKEEEFMRKARTWYAILGVVALITGVLNGLVDFMGMVSLRMPLLISLVLVLVVGLVGIAFTRKLIESPQERF